MKRKAIFICDGGVLLKHRNRGVTQQRAKQQEIRTQTQGFKKVIFKTRNADFGMLTFALKNYLQLPT